MPRIVMCCVVANLLLPLTASAADKVTKETLISGGRTRTYYLLAPQSARKGEPAPLLVLLHGSGRDGRSLVDKWESLAKKEGIVVVGPDALPGPGWNIPADGPDYLHDLVEELRQQLNIDPRRVYLFGHSAGAGHALMMAVLESEYFAAVAVHAGAMHESNFRMIERAPRKTPIAMWVGTNDALFPLPVVRATRDALKAGGFTPELTEISGHTHWYYDRAPQINRSVWTFLRQHALTGEPRYEHLYLGR
jgi:poly(3-hydroxybutyrate) depolymerase